MSFKNKFAVAALIVPFLMCGSIADAQDNVIKVGPTNQKILSPSGLSAGTYKIIYTAASLNREDDLTCVAMAYRTGFDGGLFAQSCDYNKKGTDKSATQTKLQKISDFNPAYFKGGLTYFEVDGRFFDRETPVKCHALAERTGFDGGLFAISCDFK